MPLTFLPYYVPVMTGSTWEPQQAGHPDLRLRLRDELDRIDERLRALLVAMDRLQGLLDAVVAISREVELPAVLDRIVTTAMELVGARYGALGVLDESGDRLKQFFAAGLSEGERADIARAALDLPRGLGVLGHLIKPPRSPPGRRHRHAPVLRRVPARPPVPAHPARRLHQRARRDLRRPLPLRAA